MDTDERPLCPDSHAPDRRVGRNLVGRQPLVALEDAAGGGLLGDDGGPLLRLTAVID